MRAVLDEWDPSLRPTESEMETLLVQTLSVGGWPRIQEHSDEFQQTRDARRRNRIVAANWRVLSARHRDLRDGGGELLEAIADTARCA